MPSAISIAISLDKKSYFGVIVGLTASSISSAVSVSVLIFLSLCNHLEISTIITNKSMFFFQKIGFSHNLSSSQMCRYIVIIIMMIITIIKVDLQVLKDADDKTVVSNSH